MNKKRNLLATSLVIQDENEEEYFMHISRLDKNGGLIVWPGGDKSQHVHYYKDSRTGQIKQHVKDEKTGKRYKTNLSLKQLEDLVLKKAMAQGKNDSPKN